MNVKVEASIPGNKRRVLLVDDVEDIRSMVKQLLSRHPGLEIVGQAHDGAEAVREAERLRPDVILMDIHMPVMDGIAATRAIKKFLPATRIIVVSVSDGATHRAAREAGADGICDKADVMTRLPTMIESVLPDAL